MSDVTEINYLKCDCVPNKYKPEGAPLCALYYDIGKGKVEWQMGVNKAIRFMQTVEEMYDDYVAKDGKHHDWQTVVDLGNKPDGKPNRFKLSWVRLEVLKHFEKEIKEYISLYSAPKEAIPEPKIITKMDSKTGDYVDYLALPCYPKKDNDTGEGLVPKMMTQSDCAYMFNPDSKGVTMRVLKEHYDSKGKVPYTTTINTKDGRTFPLKFSVEEIECLLKYRRIIQNYSTDPSCICDD